MSDYLKRLTELEDKRHKIDKEAYQILKKRKQFVGRIAEKFHLLKQSDELLYGMFAEAEAVINAKSEKVKQWELAGKSFMKTKQPAESGKERVTA